MYYIKKILIIGLLLFSLPALSQSQCQEDIDQAKKLFDEGAFREAEKITKQILETCDLNKTQENEMLKLMASIYYEMDDLEQGDEYIARFMKKNPYYIASKKNDPSQFLEAAKKLKSFPRFSVSLRGGVPFGQITTEKIFPVLDTADYLQSYDTKPVLVSRLDMSLNICSFMFLEIGSGIRIQKIVHQVPLYSQLYFNYEEQYINYNFPISLGFTIPLGSRFASQVYFGGELELLSRAKYSYSYSGDQDISNNLSFYLNKKKTNIKISPDQRNKYRYAAQGGVKLIYKIDRFGIFTDCRYIKEFDLYNNPDKRYSDRDLLFDNNYVLSDIMIENFEVSLGFVYNFSYTVKSKY